MRILNKYVNLLVKVRSHFMETKLIELTVKRSQSELNGNGKRILSKEDNDKIKMTKLEELSKTPVLDEYGNEIVEDVTDKEVPIKSENDNKEYLTFTLNNGLRLLLISDVKNLINTEDLANAELNDFISEETSSSGESSSDGEESTHATDGEYKSNLETTKTDSENGEEANEKLAACALTVGVGSFSDPEIIPGLAHFLEHMVFMGSEKYPKENDFDSYISTRGGSDNAITECEHTTFYFECPEIHLEGALDRFANFFISPRLNRESISKEREAVESEFKMHLSSDATRLEQIFCSTATPENPAHKFMWGNLITLKENVNDDVLYDELRKFWKRHYSAHRMTVAIQARLPMDILSEWGTKYFGNIPNNNLPPEIFSNINSLFKKEFFHKLYTVQPIKDKNQVLIAWEMPSVINLYKSKPDGYFTYLIGHEGRGSLFAYLQEKLWAISVVAGTGDSGIDSNSIYSLFTIEIILTEDGLENIDKVLCSVFSYIKLIDNTGPVESIFKEIQLIDDMNFRFADEDVAADYVEDLSQNMQIYPPQHYINGNQVIYDYNPEKIKELLKCLTPEKANVILTSTIAAAKVKLDKTEPWFGTKYRIDDIPKDWTDQWTNCEPYPDFYLPEPNQYITTDFAQVACDNPVEYPELITKDKYFEVWYKQDTKFNLPSGYIKISMISPTASILPHNRVMCEMFVTLFTLETTKDLYPATVAGLNYRLDSTENGLYLSVDGYNEKLPLLLQTLLTEMTTFTDKISNGLFEVVREQTRKKYYNQMLKVSHLANDLRLSILTKPYWPSTTKINTLPHITLDKLKEFSRNVLEHLYVKCLIQGNFNKTQALAISNSIKETINYKPIIEGSNPHLYVRELPIGENVLRVGTFNKNDPNCVVTNYYQFGKNSIYNSCKIDILLMIIQEPLFDKLRTQEQLGYDVSCQARLTNGILGFTVTVKSRVDKFPVEYVEERITNFLKTMKEKTAKMSLTAFNQIKESMKILKQQVNNDLKTEVYKNWSEIINDDYLFDRKKKEANCVDGFTREDIAKFFRELLSIHKGNIWNNELTVLRKLSIQVDGENSTNNEVEEEDENDISPNEVKDQHFLKIKLPIEETAEENSKNVENMQISLGSLYTEKVLDKKLTQNQSNQQSVIDNEYNAASFEENLLKDQDFSEAKLRKEIIQQNFIDDIEAFNNDLYIFPVTNQSAIKIKPINQSK